MSGLAAAGAGASGATGAGGGRTAAPGTAIVFVGHAVLDHVFHVDHLQQGGGKSVAHAYACRAGGLALNAALAAQRLRGAASPAVRLASACGDDMAGSQLRQAWREAVCAESAESADGGEAAFIVVPGARTSVSAVLVDAHGERQVRNFRGDAFARAPLPAAAALEGAIGVQADPRWPAAARWALQAARTRGITALLDAEVAEPAVLRELVPLADWVVFSAAGFEAWAGAGARPEAVALPPGAQVVVTQGARGLWWRPPDGRPRELPAFEVEARDTNGAGDTLHGALLLLLAEGLPPAQALRRAMAAAALACTGTPPTRAALDEFLGHRPTMGQVLDER